MMVSDAEAGRRFQRFKQIVKAGAKKAGSFGKQVIKAGIRAQFGGQASAPAPAPAEEAPAAEEGQ